MVQNFSTMKRRPFRLAWSSYRSLVERLGSVTRSLRQMLVGDRLQDVRDTVEPRAPLVIRVQDVPGRVLGVGGREHPVARPRVLVPARPRLDVHRRQLPAPQRIVDARGHAPLLLLRAHFEPQLDELDPGAHDPFLRGGTEPQEILILLLAAELHHVLDAGAVVPASIEDDDLARCREMRDVALHVHLRLLAVRRRGQRDVTEYARADSFGERADRPTLSGGVAPLEDDDDPVALVLDPLLQEAQLTLKLAQLLRVLLVLHPTGCGAHARDLIHSQDEVAGRFRNPAAGICCGILSSPPVRDASVCAQLAGATNHCCVVAPVSFVASP